jgi:pentose-5-phosphate-3-epimerase
LATSGVEGFIDAGADMVTVQCESCADVNTELARIRAQGAAASLGAELHEPLSEAASDAESIDRYRLMGTSRDQRRRSVARSATARVDAEIRTGSARRRRPVFVDGGIGRYTVKPLADAGAYGVIPDSIVFGHPDPCTAVGWLQT